MFDDLLRYFLYWCFGIFVFFKRGAKVKSLMSIVVYLACFMDITLFRCSLTVASSAVEVAKLSLWVILSPSTVHLIRFIFILFLLRSVYRHNTDIS